MQVKPYSFRRDATPVSVADAVEHDCTPDPYSYSGALEIAAEHANKTARMLGGLIEVLCDKGLLTAEELGKLVSGEVIDG